jgi:hypothetical protein
MAISGTLKLNPMIGIVIIASIVIVGSISIAPGL